MLFAYNLPRCDLGGGAFLLHATVACQNYVVMPVYGEPAHTPALLHIGTHSPYLPTACYQPP